MDEGTKGVEGLVVGVEGWVVVVKGLEVVAAEAVDAEEVVYGGVLVGPVCVVVV